MGCGFHLNPRVSEGLIEPKWLSPAELSLGYKGNLLLALSEARTRLSLDGKGVLYETFIAQFIGFAGYPY